MDPIENGDNPASYVSFPEVPGTYFVGDQTSCSKCMVNIRENPEKLCALFGLVSYIQ